MNPYRKDRQRQRALERAVAKGDGDTRVTWLLPYDHTERGVWLPPFAGADDYDREVHGTDRVTVTSTMPDDAGTTYTFTAPWRCDHAFVQRVRPPVNGYPPAIAARAGELSDCYLLLGDSFDAPHRASRWGVEPIGAPQHIADDSWGTLREWYKATLTYLVALGRAEARVTRYWHEHGMRMPVRWGLPGPMRRWRATVEDAFADAVAASRRYRPVFEEMSTAIGPATRAFGELTRRYRRLHDWQQHRLWHLVPADNGLLAVRHDVTGIDGLDRDHAVALPEAYRAAYERRVRELAPVTWDEASVRACDSELAAMFADDAPVVRGRHGEPLTRPAPITFEQCCGEEYTFTPDWFSDEDRLREDRERRDEARGRQAGRSDARRGGSYPTDLGVGGDHGSAGDLGGGYSTGTSFGTSF